MVGPEQRLTQPGKTVVCGDSHTATHGALETLAFGMEQVKWNMFWRHRQFGKETKTMGIEITGELQKGVYAEGYNFTYY